MDEVDRMYVEEMKSEITNAIGAHGAWKMRLRTAIRTQQSDVKAADVRCDDRCEFGKWLHGPNIDATTKANIPYQVVKRLHRDFHIAAADVIASALSGQGEQAEALMADEFTLKSEKLVRALTKWKRELD